MFLEYFCMEICMLACVLWNNVIVPAAHEIVVFLDQPVGRSGGGEKGGGGRPTNTLSMSWGGETDRHSSQVLTAMTSSGEKIKKSLNLEKSSSK